MGNGRTTVYNRITSKEKLSAVNPRNLELGEDFLDYLSSIDRADSTIKQYAAILNIFWCWNEEYNGGKFYVDLKKREIAKFQNHAIKEWGWSSSRIRTVKSALSSLGNYVENILDDEYENFRPIIRKIESPTKAEVRQKSIFTEEELQTLLDCLVDKKKYKQACMLSLAMNSGRRKSELTRFKITYFSDSCLICDGALYKTPEQIRTKGHGSHGKMLHVYTLASPFKPYFDLWMEDRKRLGIYSPWLFPVTHGTDWENEPMNPDTLNSWALTFTKILGKPFYWHSLRHFFTTKLSEANLPDSVIQDVVGWESADMVKIYNDTSTEASFEKYFGKDGIKNVRASSLLDL